MSSLNMISEQIYSDRDFFPQTFIDISAASDPMNKHDPSTIHCILFVA